MRSGDELASIVAQLREPGAYPGEVRAVESVETHMSWVFLTDVRAYKLKKPIRTSFFDNTRLGNRERACRTELRLNRRLAASVYLDVVPVVSIGGRRRVDAQGPPLDWLLEMRRVPADRMLDTCIAHGGVRHGDLVRLAAVLDAFYASAERNPIRPAVYRAGIAADVDAKVRSLSQRHYGLDAVLLRAAHAAQRSWFAEHGRMLEARADRVVDAHGDLRPEHVCLEPVPVVIDCLDFSRELRLLDPLSELSFLALECRRLGAAWIGETLRTMLAPRFGAASEELLAFYESYHALVRAAVAVWHLDDDPRGRADVWRKRAAWYLSAAVDLLACHGRRSEDRPP